MEIKDEPAREFGAASKESLTKVIECWPLFHSLALPRAVEPGTYRPRWAFTYRGWVSHSAHAKLRHLAVISPITFTARRKSLFLNAFCSKCNFSIRR